MFKFEANKTRTFMEIFFNEMKIGGVELIGGNWCWRIFDKNGFIEQSGRGKNIDACRNTLVDNYKKTL